MFDSLSFFFWLLTLLSGLDFTNSSQSLRLSFSVYKKEYTREKMGLLSYSRQERVLLTSLS